jgi:hypothetical protein
MSESRVHTCKKQQEMAVEEHRLEGPGDKCRCRKYVTLTQATEMVQVGEASWVVLRRVPVSEDVCSLCEGDPEVKNCANCYGTGKEEINGFTEVYGVDVVQVSRPMLDEKKRKYKIMRSKGATQKLPAVKTPRTPTIESEHIENAYSDGLIRVKIDGKLAIEWVPGEKKGPLVARARIEEYGRLIYDARAFQGKDRIPTIKPEPEDNASLAQGRTFDYGRTI